jgi:hypothetical protein
MTRLGLAAVLLVAFVMLLRLALPRSDGTPRRIAANEHVTSVYAVLLVGLLVGSFALAFTSLE